MVADHLGEAATGERRTKELRRRAIGALDRAVGARDDDRVAELVDEHGQPIALGLSVMALAGDAIRHRAECVAEAPGLVGSGRLKARRASAGDLLRAPRQRSDRTGDGAR